MSDVKFWGSEFKSYEAQLIFKAAVEKYDFLKVSVQMRTWKCLRKIACMSGLLAQLVRALLGVAEVVGSNLNIYMNYKEFWRSVARWEREKVWSVSSARKTAVCVFDSYEREH